MRKVFLDDLPRWGKLIRWTDTIGYDVSFVYDDVQGTMNILNYDVCTNYLTVKFGNNKFQMRTSHFINCNIGNLIGVKSSKYIFDIGELVETRSGKLKILEQMRRRRNCKWYKYECAICKNVDEISEFPLKNKHGCNVCSGRKVLVGYNDIWTNAPWLGELLWDHEDGYRYTVSSDQKVDFKCDCCGLKIKNQRIATVYSRRLSCPKCSDGISIPEKFTYHILEQLNEPFEFQYSPLWAVIEGYENEKLNGKKFYDFYLSRLDCTIETHGAQHKNGRLGKLTAVEQQENDRLKRELSLINTSEHIEVNMYESEFEYLKSNLGKALQQLGIDIDKIDWIEAWANSQNSWVKVACDLWNSGDYTTNDISKIIKLSRSALINYLKRGAKLGWCNYDPKEEKKKNTNKKKKSVVQLSLNEIRINEHDSARDAARKLGSTTSQSSIGNVCKGKQKTAGGFKWMYKEDYDKYIS